MKTLRDKTNEDHRRATGAGKVLPTTLPNVPTPIENDNQEWARKFEIRRHPGGNPFGFDEDTLN